MIEVIERVRDSRLNIAIFGDIMLDHYLSGSTDRISPEAPIQVVDIEREEYTLGGAGNVVHNLIALSANVSLFSLIGDDMEGAKIIEMLSTLNVKTTGVIKDKKRRTTLKSRILSRNQQMIRFDREDRKKISDYIENVMIENFERRISGFDIVLISDYGKGVVSDSLSKRVIDVSNRHGIKTLVDPKGGDYSKYRNAYLVKPNRKEAFESLPQYNSIELIGHKLLKSFNFDNVMITLSENGVRLFSRDGKIDTFPTKAKEVFDVTGAGDTVLASLGVALASGIELQDAIQFANSAAAIVISKVGTTAVTLNEIVDYELKQHSSSSHSKVVSWQELKDIVHQNKKAHKKVIFTNGCFDILHAGHVQYLEKARNFGDLLIVGLNSDKSVRELKGESRPVNGELDRASVLAGLQSVDYITIFEEDTPYNLIDTVKPNILVKGGDYLGKTVVGSELVNEVKLVNFLEGRSTSSIIKKIEENK
jgi:D-beta-D-heptose 7-phosphate kinase/D-beta-D-heptose 1-phosphate adenosyltransferase